MPASALILAVASLAPAAVAPAALAPAALAPAAHAPAAHAPATSATARAAEHAYAAAGVGLSGAGLKAGAYGPDDTAVELESGVHRFWLDFAPYTLQTLRVKKFVGNSFYASLGYGIGRWQREDGTDGAFLRGHDLAIGNEWTLARHLVIGAEWVSLGQLSGEAASIPTLRLATFTLGTSF